MVDQAMQRISLEGLVSAHIIDSGLTRSKFANELGIKTWRTLKHKIRGESPMAFSEAVALSDALGITLDELNKMLRL